MSDTTTSDRQARERIGAHIRHIRENKGISQHTLGESVGVPKATVCRWESGERPIRTHHLRRLAEILGLSVAELIP